MPYFQVFEPEVSDIDLVLFPNARLKNDDDDMGHKSGKAEIFQMPKAALYSTKYLCMQGSLCRGSCSVTPNCDK